MSNQELTTTFDSNAEESLFPDLLAMSQLEIKKEEVAIQLAALVAHSETSRSELSTKLGWAKSQITRLLSGKSNPTIKTIHEFVEALGYDFTLAFHLANNERPRQPWEKCSAYIASSTFMKSIEISVKSQQEILNDIATGTGQKYYVTAIQEGTQYFGYEEFKSIKSLPPNQLIGLWASEINSTSTQPAMSLYSTS